MRFNGAENARMQAVVEAFQHSWRAYRQYAWGHDELLPISRSYTDSFVGGGVGLTLVDALDTMYVMGLADEFREARDWVARNLTFDKPAVRPATQSWANFKLNHIN